MQEKLEKVLSRGTSSIVVNIAFKTTEVKSCTSSNKTLSNGLAKGIDRVWLWDENEGGDFCVNLHLGMQDDTYFCVYQLFDTCNEKYKLKEFWLLLSFGCRAYRESSTYLNFVTANWVMICKTFFKLLQFHFCFKLHNVKKCHRHLAIILEDHHQSIWHSCSRYGTI